MLPTLQEEQFKQLCVIYISLQLCKMTDARASHINAKQVPKRNVVWMICHVTRYVIKC
jgi:hypothetical protein